jgi:catalase
VHNNQRDGMHRQAIARGRVSYEPNSLAGGCPFQAGQAGFVSFPEPVVQDELRGKPMKFAEHYNQAKLFFESQTDVEQAHIIAAFRFELSKVTVPAVRERVVSMLANVSDELAAGVAEGLGMDMPAPMPRVLDASPTPEVDASPALSLMARTGDGGVRSRKVAIVVADGCDGEQVGALQKALFEAGAIGRLVGPRIGPFKTKGGDLLDADASLENEPGVLFDALVVPGGRASTALLATDGRLLEHVKDQFRHCKTLMFVGEARAIAEACGIDPGVSDPGLLLVARWSPRAPSTFIEALARHRHFERETDPPEV